MKDFEDIYIPANSILPKNQYMWFLFFLNLFSAINKDYCEI